MPPPDVVLTLRTEPGELGVIRASIRSPVWTREAWFSTDGVPLRQDATPFVPIAVLTAMRYRARLVVEGEVSPLLLSNLAGVQRMFGVMRPRWRVIPVRAPEALVDAPAVGVGAFLSMGLDSLSVAARERDRITDLIHLRNFGAGSTPVSAGIEEGVRALAERDGKRAIFLDSNLREMSRGVANWTRFHGAGLAGAALSLSPVLGTVMVAATRWERETVIYPSTELLDPLWSSDETRITHEGARFSRTEKAMSISADQVALRYIHPCFLARGREYNCGRCGKCLRTMASLRIAGVVDAPAFDHPLDLQLLASQPGTLPVLDAKYRELLWAALTFAPQDTALVDAVRAAMIPPRSRVARYRRVLSKRAAV